MIELIKATKYYPTSLGPHYVFRDVSLKLRDDVNIGVIGPNGAGKSTLLRLLGGVDIPSSGKILRSGKISWPLGLTAGLQRTLTGRENARFACRIYGLDASKIKAQLGRIQEISGIGKFFDLPVSTYSAGMRSRVSFAISISLEFDYYLFDEISAGGDASFAKMAQDMMRARLKSSRFILASHKISEILDLCQAVILLKDGTFSYFDDVREGIRAYGADDRFGHAATAGSANPEKPRHGRPVTRLDLQQRILALNQRLDRLATVETRQSADAGSATSPAMKEETQQRLAQTRSLIGQVRRQLDYLQAPRQANPHNNRAGTGVGPLPKIPVPPS